MLRVKKRFLAVQYCNQVCRDSWIPWTERTIVKHRSHNFINSCICLSGPIQGFMCKGIFGALILGHSMKRKKKGVGG